MHPVCRFWWCLPPFCIWPVKKVNIPGNVAGPPDAVGNGFAGRFPVVIKVLDSAII